MTGRPHSGSRGSRRRSAFLRRRRTSTTVRTMSAAGTPSKAFDPSSNSSRSSAFHVARLLPRGKSFTRSASGRRASSSVTSMRRGMRIDTRRAPPGPDSRRPTFAAPEANPGTADTARVNLERYRADAPSESFKKNAAFARQLRPSEVASMARQARAARDLDTILINCARNLRFRSNAAGRCSSKTPGKPPRSVTVACIERSLMASRPRGEWP
jgi:hypothetical protein